MRFAHIPHVHSDLGPAGEVGAAAFLLGLVGGPFRVGLLALGDLGERRLGTRLRP